MARPDRVDGSHAKIAEESGICGDIDGAQLESRFECPICLTWLRDPVLTSCGHKFCFQCINTWLRKEGACCPVDSKPLKPESDLFRDLYTSREISQQRTQCPYHQFGCTIELSPIDMETHVSQCAHKRNSSDTRAIRCFFKDVGCAEEFQSDEARQLHLEKNVNLHLTLVGTALPRLTALSQVGANARVAETKWWDPPPKKGTISERDQPSTDWQQLLKTLYERVVVLEQQNRELTIALSNQQNQLTTLQTSIRFNQEETFLRHCNGVYVWRLSSFREKLAAMNNVPPEMFYSPGFYTCSNGYKVCARINVSSKDPNYLTVLVHMMRSENDDALDWPFNGLICFVLVHPFDSDKNIRDTTTSRPELEAFGKPTYELNRRGFGYTEFVSIRELASFLRDDCLVFRIEVRAV